MSLPASLSGVKLSSGFFFLRPHMRRAREGVLRFHGREVGFVRGGAVEPPGSSHGTQNMNGSLTGNAWKNLFREAKRLTLDVLLIQEHNLPVEDPRRLHDWGPCGRPLGPSDTPTVLPCSVHP